MSARRHPIASPAVIVIFAAAVSAAAATATRAEEPGVVFRTAQPPTAAAAEAVSVLEPAGGQYVHSNQSARARAKARFAIGKAPRTEYEFFSPEEQYELRALQNRLSDGQTHPAASDPATRERSTPAHIVAHPHPRACAPSVRTAEIDTLPWPKVLQDGTKVCVPKLEFADKADWRDHVWCFDQGDGRVR